MMITKQVTELFSIILVFQSLGFAALFFGIYLYTHHRPKKYMGWFMIAGAGYFLENWLTGFGYYRIAGILYPFTLPLVLCQLPCFYWYFRSITNSGYKAKYNLFYHLIPAFVVLLPSLLFYVLPPEAAMNFLQKETTDTQHTVQSLLRFVFRLSFYIILPAQLLFYLVRFRELIKEYRIRIEEMYSFKDKLDLNWMRTLLIALLLLFLLNDAAYLARTSFTSYYSPFFFTLGMIAINFYLGYNVIIQAIVFTSKGVKIPAIAGDAAADEIPDKSEADTPPERMKYKRSSLKTEAKEHIMMELTRLMKGEELFTNPNLNIDQVAGLLNVNSKYLSQTINEEYKQNFYTYINELRVEKAKQLLSGESHGHYSVEGIASQVGFQSKSSFYTAFRKSTGMTPAGFREKH